MPDEASFYDLLMDICRRAFEGGQVEVAFHALSAAGHAAEDERSMERLGEVERNARDLLRTLDSTRPEHRFSSESSKVRGHQSIFEQLAVTASGMRTRIKTDRQRAELRASRRVSN